MHRDQPSANCIPEIVEKPSRRSNRIIDRGMRSLALALALLIIAGCGGQGPKVVTESAPPGQLPRLRLIVVYPVAHRWPAGSEESYRKTADLIEAMGNGRGIDLLGPGEIAIKDAISPEIASASNALYVASQLGVPAREVGLVRVRIEQRVQQGIQQALDAAGRTRAAQTVAEATYIVHGELWQYLPARLLAAYSAAATHDPFAEHPDWDPHPVIRQAVQVIGRRLSNLLQQQAISKRTPDPGFTFFENHAGLLSHTSEQQPSLAAELKQLDSLERELRVLQAFQYFQPSINPRQALQLASQSPGLVVVERHPSGEQVGLQPHDIVIGVGDVPIAYTFQLRRELARQPSPTLVVRRGAEQLRVPLHDPRVPARQ